MCFTQERRDNIIMEVINEAPLEVDETEEVGGWAICNLSGYVLPCPMMNTLKIGNVNLNSILKILRENPILPRLNLYK